MSLDDSAHFMINEELDQALLAAKQNRLTPEEFSIELIKQIWKGNEAFTVSQLVPHRQMILGDPGDPNCKIPIFTSREKAESFLRKIGKSDTYRTHPVHLEGILSAYIDSAFGWHLNPAESGNIELSAQNLQVLHQTSRLYTGGMYSHQVLRLFIAHAASFGNEEAMKKASACGCFKCKTMFTPAEITEWIPEQDGRRTALCPYCGVDAVVPKPKDIKKDGYFFSESVLREMHRLFFDSELSEDKDPNMRMLFLSIMRKRAQDFLQSRSSKE